MTEQITQSGVYRDCPECSDSRYTAYTASEWRCLSKFADSVNRLSVAMGKQPNVEAVKIPDCALCNGTGKAQVYGICPDCGEPTYDYGESAWCIQCDVMVAATGCRVGSAA